MNKIVALSLAAAFAVTASSAFAGDKTGHKTCCASEAGKKECSEIYAKLNLTPEQKTKLDAFQERCVKDGCTDDSMKKFLVEAKTVLTPEQYTQLQTECTQMEKHGAKSES